MQIPRTKTQIEADRRIAPDEAYRFRDLDEVNAFYFDAMEQIARGVAYVTVSWDGNICIKRVVAENYKESPWVTADHPVFRKRGLSETCGDW